MTTNDYIKSMTDYNKQSYENLKELAAIQKKSVEQIAEQQLALFSLMVETNSKYFESLSKSKGYKDLLNAQSELGADVSGKVLGIARNTADILNESKDEVSAWVEKQAKSIPTVNPFIGKAA